MISFLIKPASGLCNIACGYCFYRDEVDRRARYDDASVPPMRVMTDEVADAVIARAFEFERGARQSRGVSFAFQGGEPTLAGAGFFERFAAAADRHNTEKLPVAYSIQTNGVAVTRESGFCELFSRLRFLVGVSVDGDARQHNSVRVDREGKGTHSRALGAAELLLRSGVDVNILTVLTDEGARSAVKTYNFLKSHGFMWQQYINCLAPLPDSRADDKADRRGGQNGGDGGFAKYALSPERWLRANESLFYAWRTDFMSGRRVSVRHFDNLLGIYCGYEPEQCDMRGQCSLQFVVEADGTAYPCDFYCLPEYAMGNIVDSDIKALAESDAAKRFLARKKLPQKCLGCDILPLCRGGCMRLCESGGEYEYCAAFREFIGRTDSAFREMAAVVRRERSAAGRII